MLRAFSIPNTLPIVSSNRSEQWRLTAIGESEVVQLRHAKFFADDSDTHFNVWLSPRQIEEVKQLQS
jgi:hypothetical protein